MKTVLNVLKACCALFMIFLAILLIPSANDTTARNNIWLAIIFLIIAALIVINIFKPKRKKRRPLSIGGKHINGLPFAEGIFCLIHLQTDGIKITGNNMELTLNDQKILNMCVKTDVEIQKQYTSSIGGAVAGGVLFGPVGAIIGGRTQEKKTKTTHYYLIITYKKDNEVQYIGFDMSTSPGVVRKFVNEFSIGRENTVAESIEL